MTPRPKQCVLCGAALDLTPRMGALDTTQIVCWKCRRDVPIGYVVNSRDFMMPEDPFDSKWPPDRAAWSAYLDAQAALWHLSREINAAR